MLKKVSLLFCFCIAITCKSFSQSYDFDLNGEIAGWFVGIKMKGVTVEPTRLIIHAQIHDKYNKVRFTIPQSLILYIPSIYQSYPVTSIEGAGYGTNVFKSGKKHDVDFVVALDWNKLIRYADNPLFVMDILTMVLTTNKEFTSGSPGWDTQDWRMGPFVLPLTHEQQATLGCGAFLSGLTKKGEFETTAAYNARMQPDSLRQEISNEMLNYLEIVVRKDAARLQGLKPTLSYNADAEVMTVNYNSSLTKLVQFKVPAAKARQLKEQYEAGKYYISPAATQYTREGNFLITYIQFYSTETKKNENFKNLITEDLNKTFDELTKRVINELAKKHVNGKMIGK